jgi:hypothetical protein
VFVDRLGEEEEEKEADRSQPFHEEEISCAIVHFLKEHVYQLMCKEGADPNTYFFLTSSPHQGTKKQRKE